MKRGVFVAAFTFLVAQQIAGGVFLKSVVKTGKPVELIDDNESANIERIAQEVCRTIPPADRNVLRKQLSRVSSINRLAAFFRALCEGKHELSRCAKLSLVPLERLAEVLSVSNRNVCSSKKISLLENYHREFVSTAFEHVAGRRNDELNTPHMIRNFFMNYALEISAICRKSLLSNIEWDVYNKFTEDEYRFVDLDGVLENILSKLTKYSQPVQRVDDFEDLFISWDANLVSMLNTDTNYQDEINGVTGELIRLRMKVKNLAAIQRAQMKCRHQFKPIYTKLLIPIVKLANLGYAWTGDRLERESNELRSSKLASNWYSVAQVCEALLPIKFYQDKTLAWDAVQVINDEEAKRLSLLQSQLVDPADVGDQKIKRLFYEPVTNSMEHIDRLEWVDTNEALGLIKLIKLDKSADERAMDRAMDQIAKNFRQARSY